MYTYAQFWDDKAPEANFTPNSAQIELALLLLSLMAKRLCYLFHPTQFDDYYLDSKEIREAYRYDKQYDSAKGAIICTQGITSYRIASDCLAKWGIANTLEHPCYYQMTMNADDIATLKPCAKTNMQLYGFAIASFFELDIQLGWDEHLGIKNLKTPQNMSKYFHRAELVTSTNHSLVWSEKIQRFLINGLPSSCYNGNPDFDDPVEEEAEEFFLRLRS